MLQSGRATSPESLAVSCGLSKRTVLRDIEAIRVSGIPLVFDKDNQRYDLVQDFFLKPTYLTPDEALALVVCKN
ncbi:MAG: hypothetical protein FWC50_15010 [Planctomycetaceae bacterium]|nr:hypothetical protein [Planctomycetaceae bacterium]